MLVHVYWSLNVYVVAAMKSGELALGAANDCQSRVIDVLNDDKQLTPRSEGEP